MAKEKNSDNSLRAPKKMDPKTARLIRRYGAFPGDPKWEEKRTKAMLSALKRLKRVEEV